MKIFILETYFKEKSITLNKDELGYFEIINIHLSKIDFKREEKDKKRTVLKFKTVNAYHEAFNIISEKEK